MIKNYLLIIETFTHYFLGVVCVGAWLGLLILFGYLENLPLTIFITSAFGLGVVSILKFWTIRFLFEKYVYNTRRGKIK